MKNFSVLMSLYIKEKPEFARMCFDSLLNQTVQAEEWVIIEDGPLSQEMYALLEEYQRKKPGLIKRVPLKKNMGLGEALRIGVIKCKNELIARMDTDDIAKEDRFEKQLSVFEENKRLDICGSQIDEFENTINHIVARRTVPIKHEDIVQYQKRRDAFNHMTVMFKKTSVVNSGNYMHCPLMEDTYLWVRMIMNNCQCMNIDESLVYARVGHDMFDRRGGWDYLKKYIIGRKMVKETGFISTFDFVYTVLVQIIVTLVPTSAREWLFKKVLHSKKK